MNEIFVDGPGQFTSDGTTIKFTFVSVQKEGATFRPIEVLQLVCSQHAATRISAFLSSATEETQQSPKVADSLTPTSVESASEERQLLGKMKLPQK
jgi:hypothetical protein